MGLGKLKDNIVMSLVMKTIKNKLKESGMMVWLQGKKSYIVAVVGIIVNGLYAMGYIDDGAVKMADYILASLFGVTIAAKINRISKGE